MMLEDSFVIGRKEVLRPPPWPFPLDHGIDGDVAYPDLLHFIVSFFVFLFCFLVLFSCERPKQRNGPRPADQAEAGNAKSKPIETHASALTMSCEASATRKKKCKIYGFAARLELC
jgi:hypothetical protein